MDLEPTDGNHREENPSTLLTLEATLAIANKAGGHHY